MDRKHPLSLRNRTQKVQLKNKPKEKTRSQIRLAVTTQLTKMVLVPGVKKIKPNQNHRAKQKREKWKEGSGGVWGRGGIHESWVRENLRR